MHTNIYYGPSMGLLTISLHTGMGWEGRTREMGKELAQEVAMSSRGSEAVEITVLAQLWVCYSRPHLCFIPLLDLSTLSLGAHQVIPNQKVQGQRMATAFPSSRCLKHVPNHPAQLWYLPDSPIPPSITVATCSRQVWTWH